MKRVLIAVIFVIMLLAGLRIYLPYWVTDYVNGVLNDVPGYSGSIEGVNLDLYRGAYQIEGLTMEKTGEEMPVPFLDIPLIDLSVQWGALFNGRIAGEINLIEPTLNFATDTTASQTGTEADWTTPIKDLIPLRINRFTAEDGDVTFKDFGSNPQVDLQLENLQLVATNLRNVEGAEGTLPSNIQLSAVSIGGGTLNITCDANILREIPDFDLSLKFEGVHLPDLNDFADAYANLDFEKGTFDLFSEIAVSDGIVEGYIRPIITDLEVLDLSEDTDQPLQALWEGIAGFFTSVFQNHPMDQFATQVPLEGDLNEPETRVWPAIGGIFRNAFIEAFSKDVENSVSFDELIDE